MQEIWYLAKLFFSMQLGLATNFSYENDKFNPNPYAACLRRDLRASDVVIAHRKLPCKSKVFIYSPRTGRWVVARVGDRGPRAADLDLAPATTKALRANGWEHILFIPIFTP